MMIPIGPLKVAAVGKVAARLQSGQAKDLNHAALLYAAAKDAVANRAAARDTGQLDVMAQFAATAAAKTAAAEAAGITKINQSAKKSGHLSAADVGRIQQDNATCEG
eukprot:gnl/MRDRNA2_/MRDRNA2_26229_c0_seq1.p3 gnl/MRDRNA2_/MRDRNA2_26229_c0~~gnl/MRDRNA2_/MRDRNA2_26229_c0_seq1.p3  ORF type:complete len:107 (+),score=26.09 gnl/MRDRNA2_/MRDRNA2_26229_c0_seq1:486-806(+)